MCIQKTWTLYKNSDKGRHVLSYNMPVLGIPRYSGMSLMLRPVNLSICQSQIYSRTCHHTQPYVYEILYTGICVLVGLRKKTVAPGAGGLDDHLRGSGSTDLFGSADAIVKHVLEVRGFVVCVLC